MQRDIHPIDQAPVGELAADFTHNRDASPAYLQWNIALYDDDVLWVIPGSHARVNSAEETASILENNRAPGPGGVRVKLKAGEGVVYANTIFHWGSAYTPRHRRTIHLGYRAFGSQIFPYNPRIWNRQPRSLNEAVLPQHVLTLLAEHEALYLAELSVLETALRAAIERNQAGFTAALDLLHPGSEQRTCLMLLSKIVNSLTGKYTAVDWCQHLELGPRFSSEDLSELGSRFQWVDSQVQHPTGELQYAAGFQTNGSPYYFDFAPEGLTVEGFLASWVGARGSEATARL
jgi:hypothetical protein